MSEAIEISEKNIQEIRNSLGSRAFLVTAPRLKIVVDTKHGQESYSVGDLIDPDTILTIDQQPKVEPEDMSHEIKVYCDRQNNNVKAVRIYDDNIDKIRKWCTEGVLSIPERGDWIVKRNGHFYVLRDDSFRDIYKLWKPGKSFNDFNDILKGTYERIGINGRSFA